GMPPWGGSVFVCGRPLLVPVGLVPVGIVPTRSWGVPLPVCRGYPCPLPGGTPCPLLGAERLSGLTAPIFRPRCCGFTDGLRTVPGGLRTVYRKRVSAFIVSAFRF